MTVEIEIPIPIEINELSNFDRGLLMLSDPVLGGDYTELATKLLADYEEMNIRLEELDKWKKKWDKGKVRGAVATGVSVVCSFFAETIDQLLTPENDAQFYSRVGIVIGAAAIVVLAGSFTLFAWWQSGRKYKEAKKIKELNKDDIELLSKFRIIVESMGAINDPNKNQNDLNIIETNRKKCFSTIRKTPDSLDEKGLPTKSKLASLALKIISQNVANNHPINQKISEIRKINAGLKIDSDLEGKGFQNVGQEASKYKLETLPQQAALINNLASEFYQLENSYMEGLYVKELVINKDETIQNPTALSLNDSFSIETE